MLITEEKLNLIIQEELGIAKEVLSITKDIETVLKIFFKNKLKHIKEQIKDDLYVDITYYNFDSYNHLNDWLNLNYRKNVNGYSYSQQTIFLTILSVNNMFDTEEILDTIQHEVHHYFQTKKSGKTFSTEKYQNIALNVNSDNEYVKYLTSIHYFKHNFELEAWINGAFNAFKNKRITTYKDFINNSELFKIDDVLKKAYNFFSHASFNDWEVKQMLVFIKNNNLYKNIDDLKILRKEILKNCKKVYDIFVRKSSRAYALLKQQYEEKLKKSVIKRINKHINFD